jgi:DNA-binding transcriptional ArsR family regulator
VKSEASLTSVFSALADDTRWAILGELGAEDLSASALAERLPVSRQAIAKHLEILEACGLVESDRVGREVRYRPLGATLDATARRLERISTVWGRRLDAIKQIAEADDRADA